MLSVALDRLPGRTHPLILASDPDRLLAEESVLAALAERGFALIEEPDPVALRYRVEAARPLSVERPLIIVTTGPLEKLPYDVWQQGHKVVLSLHDFFPNLAYPVVRLLTPTQRWRLSNACAPERTLGQVATTEYVLKYAFDADLPALARPARLIAWLDAYHAVSEPMPGTLQEHLVSRLRSTDAYGSEWPLAELVHERQVFATFVTEQWRAFVAGQTGSPLQESREPYVLNFALDQGLQDVLPRLLRSGAVEPAEVDQPDRLPSWARPGLVAEDRERVVRRAGELLEQVADALNGLVAEARWETWQGIATAWAELTALRTNSQVELSSIQTAANQDIEVRLDEAFAAWLRLRYAALAGQRLPLAHHVYHVPHYLQYLWSQEGANRDSRVALLVMDGLALADWKIIEPAWRDRHPNWRMESTLLLAQIPTITAVSRRALISGLRPAAFASGLAAGISGNASEAREWAAFWDQHEVPGSACAYLRLHLDRESAPPYLQDGRIKALCLVDDTIDELAHNARLGARGLADAVRLWLQTSNGSSALEDVVQSLLGRGFTVYVASDHGHVEARGMGQPSEGLTVQTRGQRARLYNDLRAALAVQSMYSATELWSDDGLLPQGTSVLMPRGRQAFAPQNETTVTHGGMSLDEVVVPLVTITDSVLSCKQG